MLRNMLLKIAYREEQFVETRRHAFIVGRHLLCETEALFISERDRSLQLSL